MYHNALACYQDVIVNGNAAARTPTQTGAQMQATAKQILDQSEDWTARGDRGTDLEGTTYDDYTWHQSEIDVAMWYGAIKCSGQRVDKRLLKRLFTTLWYGGLIVRKNDGNYGTWRSTGYPLAMALSHGGRILIQLPPDKHETYWGWLWGGDDVAKGFTRALATHSIDLRKNPLPLTQGRQLYMDEKKTAVTTYFGDHHFGINIALGGLGNTNPLSGQTIVPNGSHGHLYLFYLPPTSKNNGGILVGCETSAPGDLEGKDSKGRTYAVNTPRGHGVHHTYSGHASQKVDTYGGGHGTGQPNIFSGTGGLKWGGKLQDTHKKKRKLRKAKKVVDHVYRWDSKVAGGLSNMVIDLITSGGPADVMAEEFDYSFLGHPGPEQF